MSIRQLYDLQRLEQDIASVEHRLAQAQAAVGESPALKQAKSNLACANDELNALKSEQKITEYAISDISAKITVADESLYSGRIKNPKELQALQHELETLKAQRDPIEEKDLSLMEQAEAAEVAVGKRREELSQAEAVWLKEQQELSAQIKEATKHLAELKLQREQAVSAIPAAELSTYNQLKATRGDAVSLVEQGTCGRCRLTLSSAELQRARAGQQASCSSCGRLLFFD
jgi:predicted  nucleic acid-binding Zn-ribbon protein